MVMRVGGMASGMDIEAIVNDMMKAQRLPLDKIKQSKQIVEWQRDQYREMNILLNDFKNLTSITGMLQTSKYRASSVSSSNEALATATASTSASQGSYSISDVTSLAKAETWVSSGSLKKAGESNFDTSKSLKDLESSFDGTWTWSDGKVGSAVLSGEGDNDLQLEVTPNSIQSSEYNKMSVKVNGTAYQLVSGALDPAQNQASIDANGKITFSKTVVSGASVEINYIAKGTADDKYVDFAITTKGSSQDVTEKFLVQSTETFNQLISKVNKSDAGVSMFFDTATNQLSVMQKETGDFNSGNNITISNGNYDQDADGISEASNNFVTSALKLDTSGTPAVLGENSVFKINGLDTNRSTNTFEINGVTVTLKQAGTGGTATLSVNRDTDAIFNNIKDFVEKYNAMIASIQSKLSEERHRSYTPLTDEQKEQLSEKQQEQWEIKAKSGLLRRDSVLSSLLSSMRLSFSQTVTNSETNSDYNQISEIGIKTTKDYLAGGKLEINESELKKAIADNPEAVEALFIGGASTSPVSEQGIIRRLSDTVIKSFNQLKDKAGIAGSTNQQFTLGRQLSDFDNRINSFEDRLTQVEDRYWRQFTAMEKAIQQANSQSSYLMQQFSSF
ncbi:flagellar filament capping protein FliD [Domibacillus enclensis]|uniref:Flagellar hook-associated protein 2 n=1 Tax=Domibacillus enclensis TaxID=1017273 RepID=A0A1N6SIM8_9BACI|nr:flagellar filament capping protein FliD [Domibacillus enclensis]OXS79335.1 hypothetical protein B1B05_06065 [Domibacillus enclensis]SIQ40786.1 flagellar hook-associated protein 2 [Domibacillus enclensis]